MIRQTAKLFLCSLEIVFLFRLDFSDDDDMTAIAIPIRLFDSFQGWVLWFTLITLNTLHGWKLIRITICSFEFSEKKMGLC